jgi:hypothetical protein
MVHLQQQNQPRKAPLKPLRTPVNQNRSQYMIRRGHYRHPFRMKALQLERELRTAPSRHAQLKQGPGRARGFAEKCNQRRELIRDRRLISGRGNLDENGLTVETFSVVMGYQWTFFNGKEKKSPYARLNLSIAGSPEPCLDMVANSIEA